MELSSQNSCLEALWMLKDFTGSKGGLNRPTGKKKNLLKGSMHPENNSGSDSP